MAFPGKLRDEQNKRIALPGNWCVKDGDGPNFSIESVNEEAFQCEVEGMCERKKKKG